MGAEASTLLITNGDSAADLLKAAGKQARILPWRDALHIGPVPLTATFEELSAVRCTALEALQVTSGKDIPAGFAERDAAVAAHDAYDRIELWFEHDLYDQLQLMQILDFFAGQGLPDGKLMLVQADTYLCDHSPQTILGLQPQARAVTGDDLDAAAAIWTAFRHDTPEVFAAFLDGAGTALPYIRPAALRMLEELPHTGTGLTRTEQQMLHALADGADTPIKLFPAATARDDPKFMADVLFWRILERLVTGDEPLISGLTDRFHAHWDRTELKRYLSTPIALTDFGRKVLDGSADHAATNRIDLWLGGTHVTNDALWRWDPSDKALLPPV